MKDIFIHKTAEVSDKAKIDKGSKIWNWAQVRENSQIGRNCVISKGVYVDKNVSIGNNVKIQNHASVFDGATLEDGVFVGPHVCFTNDKLPRAINPDGSLKEAAEWNVSRILVKEGASIGANSTILPGVTIGKFALIGSGSVVTKDVPDFALAFGNPAAVKGFVCKCGNKLDKKCDICGVSLDDTNR